MPRTRSETPREQKVEQLLDAAQRRFQEDGFAGTSTAQLARAAGVSEKTLFWYFPSKDHLLVAVLERAMGRVATDLQRGGWTTGSCAERLYRVLRSMRSIRHLLPALHQRAAASAHVAEFQGRFRAANHRAIAAWLREEGTPERDVAAAVMIIVCFVDGVLLRNVGDRELRRLCETLTVRLAAGPGGAALSAAAGRG